MSFWRFRRPPRTAGDDPEPPIGDAAEFRAVLHAVCARLGCVVESLEGDQARLYGRLTGVVDLSVARRRCSREPRRAWSVVLESHLEGLARAAEDRLPLAGPDEVRSLLRTRLAHPAQLHPGDVHRPVADGLTEVLVLAAGRTVRTVNSSALRRWGLDVAEALRLGRHQVLDDGLLPRGFVDLDGVVLTSLGGESPCTSVHALMLPTYVDIGPAGALFAVPLQTLVLAYPLRDRSALDAAQALIVNADRLQRVGPGPVSASLYWWRPDGGICLLPSALEPDRVVFSPPDPFVAALAGLPPAG